ncbi:MAG: lysylphosphatidylglycerol synthase transmembrane domain-containing protein [Candidatus Aminicenantes bacterium]|nr:lysylphosphatidylglycerol synthase transmembrane domain-containing protein [Candidatus Aminicenantes bacterium]
MNTSRKPERLALRIIATTVIGIGSLWILHRLGYLNLEPVGRAFHLGGLWIGLVVGSLLSLLVVGAVRFHRLTRAFGAPAPFRDVLAANLIGQAVGQWLPGSLAMTEILRFGVMAGRTEEKSPDAPTEASGPKGRLGLAILVDRLLGLGVMFAVGGLAGVFLLARNKIDGGFVIAVLFLSAISLILGLIALAAPFRPNRRLQRLAGRAAGMTPAAACGNEIAPAPSQPILRRAAWEIFRLLETLKEFRARESRGTALLLLSLAAAVLNPLTLYFAAQAADFPLSFPIILAAVPLTTAAVLLPTGIAGFGGPQLLAAGVFRLLGADPGTAVAACLLQNTIVLAVQTLGGAVGWALLSKRPSFRLGRLK